MMWRKLLAGGVALVLAACGSDASVISPDVVAIGDVGSHGDASDEDTADGSGSAVFWSSARLSETNDEPRPPLRPAPLDLWFVGEEVALAGATVSFEGERPWDSLPEDAVRLLPGWTVVEAGQGAAVVVDLCDLDALGVTLDGLAASEAPAGDEAYLLALRRPSESSDAPELRGLLACRAAAGCARGLQRLAGLVREGDNGALVVPEVTLADAPAIPMRGVIEGFYGPPWGHAGRLAMVATTEAAWSNMILFAAKHDPYNVLGWRYELPASVQSEVAELVAAGRTHHVQVCYAVSPGHSVVYSDADHRADAERRLRTWLGHGVDCLVLAFDDCPKELRGADPEVYGSYAEAQADFVTDVFGRVAPDAPPSARFFYVPNDYWSEAAFADDTLPTAAGLLPEWVDIAWTGQQICAPTVTATDGREIAERVGRPVFLGENYLAKDGLAEGGRLPLGPFPDRSPELAAELVGFGVNLGSLVETSAIGALSAGYWAWNPVGYGDPWGLFREILEARAGAAAWALELLSDRTVLICPREDLVPSFDPDLGAYRSALATGNLAEASQIAGAGLAEAFQPWLDARAALEDEPGMAALAAELEPWFDVLEGAAALALDAMSVVDALAADEVPPGAATALEEAAAALAGAPAQLRIDDVLGLAADVVAIVSERR